MNGNNLCIFGNFLHRRFLSPTFFRTLVSDAVPKKVKTTRVRKSKAQPAAPSNADISVPKEINEYFQIENGMDTSVLKKFPSTVLRRCSQITERFYVANRATAQRIAEVITQDLPADLPLLEVNPGPGLLTEQIIIRDVKHLRLYEADASFTSKLQALNLPKDALRIADFNGLWRLSYLDGFDNGRRVVNLLSGLPHQKWNEEVNFRLFSIIGSAKFLHYLMYSITHQNELYALGRYEMYLVMSPLLYSRIASTKDAGYKLYRGSSIVFQLYFEHELLATLPRKHFLPWYHNSSTKKLRTLHQKLIEDGVEDWYLVKIVPRKNLFEHLLPDNLLLFASFVSQHYVSRRNRIIPSLEHWIPHCGARLILNANYTKKSSKKASNNPLPSQLQKSQPLSSNDYIDNMNIYTEFGELTPSQVLTLFNEFINWSDFHQSPFVQAVESQKHKQRPLQSLEDEDTAGELDLSSVKTKKVKEL
ncbi:dimethyladenosine transferase 2, mitochondrial [Anopheles nili]|uniref:dimethyladenosine transferase 2, mitochondrial n=1 Tax=Anopheles nili TaxID=185578 RepID=UPI00237BCB21|nr:dimethyladenosine transferase 2, mitochondrial [Anopheles nili]